MTYRFQCASSIFEFFIFILFVVESINAYSKSSGNKQSIDVNFNTCHKNNTFFSACFRREFQRKFPYFAKGVRKYGIPPLDPFQAKYINLTTVHGPINLDLSLRDLYIHGISSMEILRLNINPKHIKGSLKCKFLKPMVVIGTYKGKGNLGIFPINGAGPFQLTFFDSFLEVRNFQGRAFRKHGRKYIAIKHLSINLQHYSDINMYWKNLMNKNYEYSNYLEKFLSENWDLVNQNMKPDINSVITEIVKSVLDSVFNKLTLDDIFPD